MNAYFSIIFLFSIYLSLASFVQYVNAETEMKLGNDKYLLVYEYGFSPVSSNNVAIEIFNTFQKADLDSF